MNIMLGANKKCPLELSLENTLIIGSVGSGKTTLCQNIIHELKSLDFDFDFDFDILSSSYEYKQYNVRERSPEEICQRICALRAELVDRYKSIIGLGWKEFTSVYAQKVIIIDGFDCVLHCKDPDLFVNTMQSLEFILRMSSASNTTFILTLQYPIHELITHNMLMTIPNKIIVGKMNRDPINELFGQSTNLPSLELGKGILIYGPSFCINNLYIFEF